jgi:hypothetical protein
MTVRVCRMCSVMQPLERDFHEDLTREEAFADRTSGYIPSTPAIDVESYAPTCER